MNILVFSTDDHLYPAGGAESAMGEIMKRLPDVQFDLVCARLRKGVKQYEEKGNVRIHRLGFGIPRIDGYILALCGHLKALKLYRAYHHDVLWSVMASYGAFASVRVKRKTNIPLLLTLQEGDDLQYIFKKVRFVRRQFENIFKQADALQSISRFLQKWGVSMGFHGSVNELVPNGVDTEAFTREFSDDALNKQRKEFGFSANATVVITSSRLEVKNGVGDIIEALSLLPAHVCLVVCGSGSLEEELRAKVAKNHHEDRVRFLGFVPLESLPELLKASDIFIRPSLTEGLGTAFLEAMAAELPTIGTPVGGIPDFLTDGVTGFMCESKNPKSVADAIKRVMRMSPDEKEIILRTAREMVEETYNWDHVSNAMRNIFEKLQKQYGSNHS